MKGRNKMKIYLTDAREIRDLDTDEDFICMWDKSVHYDADMDAYPMTKDQFEWWEELLERKAHCEEMEEKISDEETRKFLLDQCDEHDLGMRVIQYERLLKDELK